MFETKRADWYFIISASLVWISALIVAAWDFIEVQEVYHFDLVNIIGFLAFPIE